MGATICLRRRSIWKHHCRNALDGYGTTGAALAAIAREYNLQHIVVVSDSTHLFRIRELCRDAGLDVYTSPRATVGHLSSYDLAMRYVHEILSYTALKLNLDIGWPRRWLAGEEDF